MPFNSIVKLLVLKLCWIYLTDGREAKVNQINVEDILQSLCRQNIGLVVKQSNMPYRRPLHLLHVGQQQSNCQLCENTGSIMCPFHLVYCI